MKYFLLKIFIQLNFVILVKCFFKNINDETFYISDFKANWYDAGNFCDTYDMNLISIRKPETTELILNLKLNDEYWSGGMIKNNNEFEIEWPDDLTGVKDGYSNWSKNKFYCIVIGVDGTWHLGDCLNLYNFICEMLTITSTETTETSTTEITEDESFTDTTTESSTETTEKYASEITEDKSFTDITTKTDKTVTGVIPPSDKNPVAVLMPILLMIPVALTVLLSLGSEFLTLLTVSLTEFQIAFEVSESIVSDEYCLEISKGDGDQNYFVSNFKANWFDALNFCRTNKMSLLKINSSSQNAQMREKFKLNEIFWSGGNDFTADRKWTWIGEIEDIKMIYEKWSRKQFKNHLNEYGACLAINNDLTWLKYNCLTKLKFVCSKVRDFSFLKKYPLDTTTIVKDLIGVLVPKTTEICI